MATPRWIGAALDVFQKDSITIALTWAAADTLTVTIGTRDLVLTVGATVTTASIAQAVLEMINGDTITGDPARSDTGDNIPEFAKVTATLFSASVVHVTANTAGVPFTMTVTENTAGTGTATRAAVTACTGANFWDNADNWDTGVVPADGDSVYIDNSDVSILYGLAQSAIEPAAMYVAQSFTGTIGLPEVNEDGGYHEYRATYLRVGPVILKVGAGPGNGSGRIRIDSGDDPCALTVYNTGSPLDDVPALLWKGSDAGNTLVMVAGSVGVAVYGAETATLATVTKEDGDLTTGAGVTLSGALKQHGGTWVINSAVATSLTQTAGANVVEGTGAVAQLTLRGGSCVYNTTGTLGGAPVVSGDASLDFSQNPATKAVTNPIEAHGKDCRILDPNKVVTTLVVDFNEGASEGQVTWGSNVRLTRGTPA